MVVFDHHRADAAGVPEVDIGTADARGTYGNGDLAFLKLFAFFDAFEGGLCFGYPELVFGVGENADIGLCEGGGGRRHAEEDLSANSWMLIEEGPLKYLRSEELAVTARLYDYMLQRQVG